VELLTGVLFLLCWWKLPGIKLLVPALALTSVLIASAFIDAENTIIPNGLVLFGAISAVLCIIATGHPSPKNALLGALAGAAPLLAIDIISRMILKKDGMGGGDVKLMAMVGLFLGWGPTLLALMLAVIAGGLAGAVLLLTRQMKRGDYFPFGPFLAAGTFVSMIFGGIILGWYAAFNNLIISSIVR
jgi:leader peptidase (prepilin peptidase) / N-methyltransferase